MRPLHDPAFHAIEDVLGEIAPIRRASLRFGKYSSRYNEILAGRATNIFDCNMASGSLMDIGVYTVEPMVEIFGHAGEAGKRFGSQTESRRSSSLINDAESVWSAAACSNAIRSWTSGLSSSAE